MNQSVEETKRRLANLSSYRHHLDGVQQADFSNESTSSWKLLLPLGFRVGFTLAEINIEENTTVFRSTEGNINITGMISFHPVKGNLTEVDLVVNYGSNSKMFNLVDRLLNVGDHYLVNQLRRLRAHFESIAAPVHANESFHGFKSVAA